MTYSKPLHIENHNKFTPPPFTKTNIRKNLDNINKINIVVDHFSADSAYYQMTLIETIEKNTKNFFIRRMDYTDFCQTSFKIKSVKKARINNVMKEVRNIYY